MSHHHKHCNHGHHDECCSHEHDSCCHEETEHHHHHDEGHEHCDFAKKLLELADEAWMEVLRDKIKANIVASSGANLDRLAKLVSESNGHRWKSKLANKKSCDDYQQKIADFFKHE